MGLEVAEAKSHRDPEDFMRHWSLACRQRGAPEGLRAGHWLPPSLSEHSSGPVSMKPWLCGPLPPPPCIPLPHSCAILSLSDSRCPAGAVRASSIFPILSVILLFMGGLCIAASEFYKTRHNIILSAGIFFVSAGNGL